MKLPNQTISSEKNTNIISSAGILLQVL